MTFKFDYSLADTYLILTELNLDYMRQKSEIEIVVDTLITFSSPGNQHFNGASK